MLIGCLLIFSVALAQKGEKILKEDPQQLRFQERVKVKNGTEPQQFEFRQRVQEKRTAGEEVRNQFLEQLRIRVKDQKRSEILQRIYLRISALNQRLCEHFTNLIEHLEKLVQRAEEKIKRAKEQGLNVTEAQEALNLAKEKINDAKQKILDQASRVYTFQIEKEEQIKLKVGELYQKFQQDVKEVREKIKEAFWAVRDLFQEIAKLKVTRESGEE